MSTEDPLAVRQAALNDAQQEVALLTDLAVTGRWQPDERAALADERDAVAEASDELAAEFDERADRRDEDARSRQVNSTSRLEDAIARDPGLEPGPFLRYMAARDLEDTRADRAGAVADRERSAASRDIAAQGRLQAASDRDEAAMDRAITEEPSLGDQGT
jgi:hypothetical protein